MKQYKRAKERRMVLTSVNNYTSLSFDGRHRRSAGIRTSGENQAAVVSRGGGIHGTNGYQPGRAGKENGSPALQHKQSDAKKDSCKGGLSAENGRVSRSEGRSKDTKALVSSVHDDGALKG